MLQKLHKNAKTNYSIRKEIKEGKFFHIRIGRKTQHYFVDNRGKNENLIVFERKKFKKTVDEIYLTLENVIPNLYPQKVYRCVRRYGLSSLPDEFVAAERKIRKFRKYTIGYSFICI